MNVVRNIGELRAFKYLYIIKTQISGVTLHLPIYKGGARHLSRQHHNLLTTNSTYI
jgi:hypothetical protein